MYRQMNQGHFTWGVCLSLDSSLEDMKKTFPVVSVPLSIDEGGGDSLEQ